METENKEVWVLNVHQEDGFYNLDYFATEQEVIFAALDQCLMETYARLENSGDTVKSFDAHSVGRFCQYLDKEEYPAAILEWNQFFNDPELRVIVGWEKIQRSTNRDVTNSVKGFTRLFKDIA